MGWGVQSPVPTGFAGNEFDYYMTRTKLNVIEAAPLHILVEGDLAIIQLIVKDITSQDGGPDETTWVAWTDIMRRDNGAWRWIADHGHVLGDNQ